MDTFSEKLECTLTHTAEFFYNRKPIYHVMRDFEESSEKGVHDWSEIIQEYKQQVRDKLGSIIKEGIEAGLMNLDITEIQYAEYFIHQMIGRSHWANDLDRIEIGEIVKLHTGKLNDINR